MTLGSRESKYAFLIILSTAVNLFSASKLEKTGRNVETKI
jgi:hypothetical protein